MSLPVGELLDQIDVYNGRLTELALSADWEAFTPVQQSRDALLSTLDAAVNRALTQGQTSPDQLRQRVLHIREVNTTLAELADATKAELEAKRLELERTAKALQAYQQGDRPGQSTKNNL